MKVVGELNQELPTQKFHLKLNSAVFTSDPVTGDAPASGKRYVVLNVTIKLAIDSESDAGYAQGGTDTNWQLQDTDGERYRPLRFIKASSAENAEHNFQKGDEYTFRAVFLVPTTAMIKKVVVGGLNARKWAFDGAIVK